MKRIIELVVMVSVTLLLFVGTATSVVAQQSGETKALIEQLETLPTNHFLTSDGTNNITLERTAANIIVAPTGNLTSTNAQAALEELQVEVDALAAGGSDGVITAIDVTGTSTKSITVTRSVGGSLGTTFTDEVNDADANSSNEIQTATQTLNDVSLSLGGGSWNVADRVTKETFTPSSGNTITLANTPDVTYINSMQVRRGLLQTVATSGTSADVTVSGTTLTFNYRNFEAGEVVVVTFIAQ